jgi:MFS family permease
MSISPPRSDGAVATNSVGVVVGFLVFTEFASGFMQGYYTPFVASIVQQHGADAAAANWFNSVFALAGAVLVPLLSKLGDRYGHRLLLRWAVGTVFLAAIIIAFAPSYEFVLLGRGLMGSNAALVLRLGGTAPRTA